LARHSKSFVLLGDGKELYHRSPSGILQRCISIAEGQELLQEIHSGGLRPSRSTPSPCWERLSTRFLRAPFSKQSRSDRSHFAAPLTDLTEGQRRLRRTDCSAT
jgi:hypothetical protein